MSKKIKNYDEFLNENAYASIATGMNPSAAFGVSDLSTINTGGSIEPKNPELSFNAWDKHKANMRDEFNRLSGIFKRVFSQERVKIGQEFENSIEDLSIIKIFRNNNGSLDIYIKFFFMEELYYGSFKNWGAFNEPTFKSTILSIPELTYQKENIYRLIGLIKDTLNIWFQPSEDSEYRALKDIIIYNEMGEQFTLPQGAKILIEDVLTQENKPIIYLSYNNKIYSISGLDYYFFNWWFKSIEKKNFYL